MRKSLQKLVVVFSFFLSTMGLSNPPEQVIKFVTEATYPPFVSMDVQGKMGGFETELVKNICEKGNLNCEFYHRPFDSLFPSLALKKMDAVYGCIGITESRKSEVVFSKPLYTGSVGFISAIQKEPLGKEYFNHKTVAIQQGSVTFEKYLKQHYPGIKIKTYGSIQDALLDLSTHRVDAVFGDTPVFKYWIKNKNQISFSLYEISQDELASLSEGNAIAMRKEDKEIIDKINAAFDDLVKDGTVDKLKKQYLE